MNTPLHCRHDISNHIGDLLEPHLPGRKGGNQDMGRTKGGSTSRYIWPWMRMVCRSEYLLQAVPQRISGLLTSGGLNCGNGSRTFVSG